MTTAETTATRTCGTCLYMATHCHCDGCLSTPEDYAEYHARRKAGERDVKMPPFRYLNWREGNWIARLIYFEREGRRNIVIGGQGEAEVNVKWTPEQTSKHLHYVAGECGYLCGNLRKRADSVLLRISTHEGLFELEWKAGRLEHIWSIEKIAASGAYVGQKSTWDFADIDIFARSKAFPDD